MHHGLLLSLETDIQGGEWQFQFLPVTKLGGYFAKVDQAAVGATQDPLFDPLR
jgi:hypothetical protein